MKLYFVPVLHSLILGNPQVLIYSVKNREPLYLLQARNDSLIIPTINFDTFKMAKGISFNKENFKRWNDIYTYYVENESTIEVSQFIWCSLHQDFSMSEKDMQTLKKHCSEVF